MTSTVIRQTDIDNAFLLLALATGIQIENHISTTAVADTAKLADIDPETLAKGFRHILVTTPPGEYEDIIHPTEVIPYLRGYELQSDYVSLFRVRRTRTVDVIEAMFGVEVKSPEVRRAIEDTQVIELEGS